METKTGEEARPEEAKPEAEKKGKGGAIGAVIGTLVLAVVCAACVRGRRLITDTEAAPERTISSIASTVCSREEVTRSFAREISISLI